MTNENKKVVSDIAGLTGRLIIPETAQATWNRSYSSTVVENIKNSSADEAEDILIQAKKTKKAFERVQNDAKKAINKATNIRNEAMKKVNQAKEIVEFTKEDWVTKVIIVNKKIQDLKSKPEKKYLLRQVEQAKKDAEQARVNFINKKAEIARKKLKLQEYQVQLETITQEYNNKIAAAEQAYKKAQIKQQQFIQRADSFNPINSNAVQYSNGKHFVFK